MSSSGAASNSKARKSLASNWPTREDSFNNPETPSKSLMGSSDASILFSPPGILKETLPDDSGFDSLNNHRMSTAGTSATSPSTSATSTNQVTNSAGRSPPKNKASCMMTLKFEEWWSWLSTFYSWMSDGIWLPVGKRDHHWKWLRQQDRISVRCNPDHWICDHFDINGKRLPDHRINLAIDLEIRRLIDETRIPT